ncbi:MAG: UDP-N-acetylglucosamine 2-epimerase (non-hydrolyzing) [Flavobacteriaceae bacterium]|nr:MAG: UDP-N-acetylglucosamine 2-epimerase (non-hydrolyzing) [Flavobacteriaceae bacterium]
MKKVVTILGARPQFVKAAVLSRLIRKYREIEEVIVHTGQHFDNNMSSVFFDEMQIPKPVYNLHINRMNHGAMTGKMLEEIEAILLKEQPLAVIVYGDTNSTLAGALAAKKIGIKVIHIEAGLRSFNMKIPEEINRILTDRISDMLLCPTDIALQNLKKEGFDHFPVIIEKAGDIMKDAVAFYSKFSKERSSILEDLKLQHSAFVLATIHRQENTENRKRLQAIFSGLEKIHQNRQVILPLHPGTKKMLMKFDIKPTITLIEPVGYFSMLELLKNCIMVITDSGGLQKEAFFNKKHCIVIRDETEWVELITCNIARVTGCDSQEITAAYQYFLTKKSNFEMPLYGNNNVGEKMYKSIIRLLQN